MKLGCTLGGAHYLFAIEMERLKECGVDVFQVFTGSPDQYAHVPPTKSAKEALKNCDYLIHAPYWISFFKHESIGKIIGYLEYLLRNWTFPDRQLLLVTHTSSFKSLSMQNNFLAYERVCKFLLRVLPILDGRIKIVIENDAGNHTSITPKLGVLIKVKEYFGDKVGLCIDTLHAFSDGEDILNLPYSKADVIHLNAVPPYVSHGNHLDRHSYTPLKSSKIDMKPIIKNIQDQISSDVPVILERYDKGLVLEDIEYIKNSLDVTKGE